MRRQLLLAFLFALPVAADPLPRWRLEYECEVPERFQTPGGAHWAIVYTLKNLGPEPAPLSIGHELRRKGDPAIGESFLPDDVLVFMASREGLKGRSRAEQEEALAGFQERGRWLTTAALTRKRELAVNETVHAIAVLQEDVHPERDFAIVVQGLEDPIMLNPFERRDLRFLSCSTRERIRFEVHGGTVVPCRRDRFVDLPPAPVDRRDLVALVSWLEDDSAVVRGAALDLLCRYVDPTKPRAAGPKVTVSAHEAVQEALKFLLAWLSARPEVARLQALAPAKRKELAEDLLRRAPVAMKEVAAALQRAEGFTSFEVAQALIDAIGSDDFDCRENSLRFIRELITAADFGFDAAKLDPNAKEAARTPEERKALAAWREWAVGFASESVWDPELRVWRARGR